MRQGRGPSRGEGDKEPREQQAASNGGVRDAGPPGTGTLTATALHHAFDGHHVGAGGDGREEGDPARHEGADPAGAQVVARAARGGVHEVEPLDPGGQEEEEGEDGHADGAGGEGPVRVLQRCRRQPDPPPNEPAQGSIRNKARAKGRAPRNPTGHTQTTPGQPKTSPLTHN